MWQPPALIPPFRFARVEQGLFRGAYPSLKNFRFLKRLKLRTIVSLLPSAPSEDLKEFCLHENIRLIFIRVEKFEENVTFTPQLVAKIVTVLGDQHNLPLFIHCLDGGHNTGLVIMTLRLLQGWNMSVIFTEFCRYVKTGEISREESQFLESFNEDIELPATPASFLSYQVGGGVRDRTKTDNQSNNKEVIAAMDEGSHHSRKKGGKSSAKESVGTNETGDSDLVQRSTEDTFTLEEPLKLLSASERNKKPHTLNEKGVLRILEAKLSHMEEEDEELEHFVPDSCCSQTEEDIPTEKEEEDQYTRPSRIVSYRYPKKTLLGKTLSKFVRSNSLDDMYLRYSEPGFSRMDMKNVRNKTRSVSLMLEALALDNYGKPKWNTS